MSKAEKFKIGIIGCGNIARRSVVPAIIASNNFDLVAICSQSLDSKAYKDVKIYRDLDDFFKLSDVQCVYIGAPTGMHASLTLKALHYGKHVWCEKSLVTNANDAFDIAALAKSNGLAVLENFQFTQHAQFKMIKSIIDAGELGRINLIRSTFCFPPFKDLQNIRYSSVLGGGALLDAGVYTLKILNTLLRSKIVIREANLFFDNMEVDIRGSISALCDNRIVAQTYFGFDDTYQCSLEISGSEKKLYCARIFTLPETKNAELLISDSSGSSKIVEVPAMDHFAAMLQHFALCITEQEARNAEAILNTTQANLIQEIRDIAQCYKN